MMDRPLFAALAALGSFLVGAVLLLAGLFKALEPQSFIRHLKNLRLLPGRFLEPVALTLIATQWGVSAALLLRLWPSRLLPISILMLLFLAVLGYWSTTTGRTADCGCYNGAFSLSPLQSLLLDGVYIMLLTLSWLWAGSASQAAPWKILAVFLVAAAGSLLAYGLLRYSVRHGKLLFELTPLKAGRRWNSRWLGDTVDLSADTGEKLVVFLGVTCSHCKPWLKVLNLVHQLADLPEVVGVVAVSTDQLADYVSRSAVVFPIVAVRPWISARLSRGVTPTAVVLKDGVIQEKWVRAMPKPFTDRVRAAMGRMAGSPTVPVETSAL
jgi:hypothetical protein